MQATDSIWLRDAPPPSRSTPLNRDRIVAAAVPLLDSHGTTGLTMRLLAEALGVTATALYWHVRTKDDVLDLALDHVFGEIPLPEVTADWRTDVRRLALSWRAVMLQHPWTPDLIGRPVPGPQVLARTEFLQSALSRAGLRNLDLAVATRLLANYVIGAALTEATSRNTTDPHSHFAARRHITANPAAYPTLNASGHLDPTRWNPDDLFTRGLDTLLSTTPTPRRR